MSHTTAWTRKSLIWTVEGVLTSSEIVDFLEEMADSPLFEKIEYLIWNTLAVTDYVMDSDDAQLSSLYTGSLEMYNKKLIAALVITNPTVLEFAGLLLEAMTGRNSEWVVAVHPDMHKAQDWLDSMAPGYLIETGV